MTIVLQTPDRLPQIRERAIRTHKVGNVLQVVNEYELDIPDVGPVIMPNVRVIHCAGVR